MHGPRGGRREQVIEAVNSLVDAIHRARDQGVGFIVFNPGAYTHTSIAIRDALLLLDIPGYSENFLLLFFLIALPFALSAQSRRVTSWSG